VTDVAAVRRRYRRNAALFDAFECTPFRRLRQRAVELLQPSAGATVLDLGCGTGLSFPLLERAVGEAGRIIGIDVSPHMLRRAGDRARRERWPNVMLIEASADRLPLDTGSADFTLCFYAHDVATSEPAVSEALRATRPQGRIVFAGGKLVTGIAGVFVNALTVLYSWPFITHFADGSRPWAVLARHAGQVAVEEHLARSAYVATATKPPS
jgi:demethylmenaquinone methyltransferase/2-methoxy-6-polyprenyl-1,4-benzoquinol methylase